MCSVKLISFIYFRDPCRLRQSFPWPNKFAKSCVDCSQLHSRLPPALCVHYYSIVSEVWTKTCPFHGTVAIIASNHIWQQPFQFTSQDMREMYTHARVRTVTVFFWVNATVCNMNISFGASHIWRANTRLMESNWLRSDCLPLVTVCTWRAEKRWIQDPPPPLLLLPLLLLLPVELCSVLRDTSVITSYAR